MHRLKRLILSIIGIVSFISLWELLSITKNDPAIVSVEKIFSAFLSIITQEKFYINLFSTLKIVFIGVGTATIFGIAIGTAMDLFIPIKNMVNPIIEMLRNIPSITLFPILLVIFGIGDASRIFVIFWTSAPPVILSTVYGLRTIDKTVIEAAQVSGASNVKIMKSIKIPLAFPEILNGVKIGIGSGFVAIVVAEMLGASSGLGYMVMWATNAFKYNETYAYIIIIALVGAIVNAVMSFVIKTYERNLL